MTQIKGDPKIKIDYTKEDLIQYYVNKWVFNWVKRYHPEAFDEARKFVEENLDNEKTN
tara:strand:- start:1082 stop:1255 length:174 start_codon:yes stop_codon:yes gene_type:complete